MSGRTTSTILRVLAFAAGLAAVFGLALVAGAAFDPIDTVDTVDIGPARASHDGADAHVGTSGSDPTHDGAASPPGGLQSAQDGYRLVLADTRLSPGTSRPLAFTVEGPEGPVTAYDVEHERRLHLIAVRRDFEGFQHVHPTLGAGGTWTTALDLTAGSWRVFADFSPSGGEPMTLGADLAVPGAAAAAPSLPETRTTTVDGYRVTVTGDLVAGAHSELALGVSRDGRPVTDLQPYLGAYGHLVVLREGDLAYLHAHPSEGPAGPEVRFGVEVPSEGGYQLFLDFRHDGVVRTAHLALPAAAGGHGEEGHGH